MRLSININVSFEEFRAKREKEKTEARRREELARKIETGAVRLTGTGHKGRPTTLGTLYRNQRHDT